MKTLLIVVLALSLNACGGGSGDSSGNTEDAFDKMMKFLKSINGNYEGVEFEYLNVNGLSSSYDVSILFAIERSFNPSTDDIKTMRNTIKELTGQKVCANYDGGYECNYIVEKAYRQRFDKGANYDENIIIKGKNNISEFSYGYNPSIGHGYTIISEVKTGSQPASGLDFIEGTYDVIIVSFNNNIMKQETGVITCDNQRSCMGKRGFSYSLIEAYYYLGSNADGSVVEIIQSKDKKALSILSCPTTPTSNFNFTNRCEFINASRR